MVSPSFAILVILWVGLAQCSKPVNTRVDELAETIMTHSTLWKQQVQLHKEKYGDILPVETMVPMSDGTKLWTKYWSILPEKRSTVMIRYSTRPFCGVLCFDVRGSELTP